MKKIKIYYILASAIFIFVVFGSMPVFAEDTLLGTIKMKQDLGPGRNFFNEIIDKIDQGAITPVKQMIKDLPRDLEDGLNHLWEKLEGKKTQKKEEVKQEIKEEIQQGGEKVEKKYLAPLKNRIQQGIDMIRGVFSSIKDFIINLF